MRGFHVTVAYPEDDGTRCILVLLLTGSGRVKEWIKGEQKLIGDYGK